MKLNRREVFQAFAVSAPLAGAAGRILTARAFDPQGKPAAARQLQTLLLIDPDGRPFELLPQLKGDGVVTVGLPGEQFQLMMRLGVPNFGEVYLYADDVRGPEVLLNYEFARSRAAFVARYVKTAQAEGVSFTPQSMKRLEAGQAALNRATSARELPERVRHSNDSLTETMWAGEMAAVERARHRIRRNGPRPGFLFGANAFGYTRSEEYARQFDALFNFGTLPFYRNNTEPVEGNLDYSRPQAVLDRTLGSPLLFKGHPLLWFKRQNMPKFLLTKSWTEMKTSCREYALETVGRFRSRIHSWDVINEAHDWANEMKYEPQQLVEITALMSKATREADPTAFRVVNNCCLWGEYVARRMSNADRPPLDRPSMTPLEYMRMVRDARVDYDAIGLQIYCPGRDMLEIERHIERFAALGKPLHITELGVPSANNKITVTTYEERGKTIPYPIDAVWHGTEWSEEAQADWVEQFYTICYSMPQVEAVTWWDFSDPGYMPNGGFLTRELRPKPSYDRLKRLIAEWRA
ncbi:MAG: endo-1,4-beta-xylanase [Bryobacteraceae bacterium]